MADATQARYEALADQHPGQVGIIGQSVNAYGTPVSVLRCADCGTVVSICPPPDPDTWGDGCLEDGCGSYDVTRDAGLFFDALAEHGLIQREAPDADV